MANATKVVLGQYKGLKLQLQNSPVTEEEIAAAIQNMQEQSLQKATVERAAQEGDELLMDYAGFADGEQFAGGTAEKQTLVLGSGRFIPGFEAQLIGVAAGEEREVHVTFPEQYHAPNLAGKAAVFKVKVHEVREQVLPEVNDAFAQDCGFDSVTALREAVRNGLQARKDANARAAMETGAIDSIIAASTIEASQAVLDAAVDELMVAFEMQLSQQGYTLDDYCKATGETKEAMMERLKPAATARVNTRAVLQAIAQAEGLSASEADMEAKLAELSKQYGMPAEELKKYISEEDLGFLREDVVSMKAIELVLANAVTE